jgi:hypothetical protein
MENQKKQTTPDLSKLPKVKEKEVEAKIISLQDLFSESLEVSAKQEALNIVLNTTPPEKWVKEHPYIRDHKYLPIDKVEYLLRKIFKRYSIVITGQGTAFNGVWVTVRVSYFNPVLNEMQHQDGIGAMQLQTAKGTSPADLANINNGALSMAFPIAKTLAIKDACDLIGNVFGANLNRRDAIGFQPDTEILNRYDKALTND